MQKSDECTLSIKEFIRETQRDQKNKGLNAVLIWFVGASLFFQRNTPRQRARVKTLDNARTKGIVCLIFNKKKKEKEVFASSDLNSREILSFIRLFHPLFFW